LRIGSYARQYDHFAHNRGEAHRANMKEGTVPLSEHEQRLLDQIEQALYAEDPKFASSVRSARSRFRARRWIVLACFGIAAGLAVVLVGLATKLVVLGVLGFVLILGSCVYIATALSNRSGKASDSAPGGTKGRSAGVRSRMEDRLRRRFEEN
jgi:Flp pilus assembly protein TadB